MIEVNSHSAAPAKSPAAGSRQAQPRRARTAEPVALPLGAHYRFPTPDTPPAPRPRSPRLHRSTGCPQCASPAGARPGKGIVAAEGDDLTIITTGAMFKTGLDVVDQLSKSGISARLVSMHTIKPLDTELVLECANTTKAIVTLEEHSLIGGLGSAVAETLVDNQVTTKLKRFGLPDEFSKTVGSQGYLLSLNRLVPKDITEEILRMLR